MRSLDTVRDKGYDESMPQAEGRNAANREDDMSEARFFSRCKVCDQKLCSPDCTAVVTVLVDGVVVSSHKSTFRARHAAIMGAKHDPSFPKGKITVYSQSTGTTEVVNATA